MNHLPATLALCAVIGGHTIFGMRTIFGTCEGVQAYCWSYDHPTKDAVYPSICCRPGDRPVWTESEVYCK